MIAAILISSLKVQMLSLLLFATFVTPLDIKALIVLNVRKVEKVVVVAAVEEKVFQAEAMVVQKEKVTVEKVMAVAVVVEIRVVKVEIIIIFRVTSVINQDILRGIALRQRNLRNFWKSAKLKAAKTTIIKEPTGIKTTMPLRDMESTVSCLHILLTTIVLQFILQL